MGMDEGAIVHSETELRRRIRWVIQEYRQPALVEEYLPGREFTVAVMGARTRRPMHAGLSFTGGMVSIASRCWKWRVPTLSLPAYMAMRQD